MEKEKHGNIYRHQNSCLFCGEPFVERWRHDILISSERLHKDDCPCNNHNLIFNPYKHLINK